MKKLLWGCVIISFLFWAPACSKKQVKSVLNDISRDTYEKQLRKRRIENIGNPNYEEPPSYDQYQRERNELLPDSQVTIPNVKQSILKKRSINPWAWQDKFGFVQANEITNARRMLFTAGIVSVDGEGSLLHPGDMEKQIRQIVDNLEEILEQANFKLSDVVRFTYYTTDVEDFGKAAHVLFGRLEKAGCKLATSLIGVDSLFHPDCVVEIEATVVD